LRGSWSCTCLNELIFQSSPIITKLIGASETAVATNTNDVVDGVLNEIGGCFESSFAFLEIRASCTANDGAPLTQTGLQVRRILTLYSSAHSVQIHKSQRMTSIVCCICRAMQQHLHKLDAMPIVQSVILLTAMTTLFLQSALKWVVFTIYHNTFIILCAFFMLTFYV